MVFLTGLNYIRSRGPDEFWKKRRTFKLTAKYLGRRRNCYSLAIRNLHRALVFATKGREQKKLDMVELWNTRIAGAGIERDLHHNAVVENLFKCKVEINRKVLADLAIWEPRTFECLKEVALTKKINDNKGLNSLEEPPEGVITRGML